MARMKKETICKIIPAVVAYIIAMTLLMVAILAMRDAGLTEFQIGLWSVVSAFLFAYALTDLAVDFPNWKSIKFVKEKVKGKNLKENL